MYFAVADDFDLKIKPAKSLVRWRLRRPKRPDPETTLVLILICLVAFVGLLEAIVHAWFLFGSSLCLIVFLWSMYKKRPINWAWWYAAAVLLVLGAVTWI